MNRHERRAQRPEFPAGYIESIERMQVALIRWLKEDTTRRPVFRLPPRQAMIIACVEQLEPRLAGNDDARLAIVVMRKACAQGHPEQEPSVTMFAAALEALGYPGIERATLAELGIRVGLPSRGGQA